MELYCFYSSPNIIQVIKKRTMGCTGSWHPWGKRKMHTFFVVIPEGKKQRRKTKCRWEVNIKMGLKEMAFYGVDWISMA